MYYCITCKTYQYDQELAQRIVSTGYVMVYKDVVHIGYCKDCFFTQIDNAPTNDVNSNVTF